MSPDFIKRKILLLGDASVGKTSLIRRFVVDKFSDDYITTIGTKVTKRDLRLELGNRTVDLSIAWSIATTHRSRRNTGSRRRRPSAIRSGRCGFFSLCSDKPLQLLQVS